VSPFELFICIWAVKAYQIFSLTILKTMIIQVNQIQCFVDNCNLLFSLTILKCIAVNWHAWAINNWMRVGNATAVICYWAILRRPHIRGTNMQDTHLCNEHSLVT
jgi:hypothetical protein